MNQKFYNLLNVLLLSLVVLIGCAHKKVAITPEEISPLANPKEELAQHKTFLKEARENQVDVLSPTHFKEAKNYYIKAEKENSAGSSSKKVFSELGYSKAHLTLAKNHAAQVRPKVEPVLKAREAAINGGDKNYMNEFSEVDKKFKNITEDKVALSNPLSKDMEELQDRYLALEVKGIKHAYLGSANEFMKKAEKKGAKKIVPNSYVIAKHKYNEAEKIIETDRHDTTLVRKSANAATREAHRLLILMEYEQASRGQTPEQRAIAMERRDDELKKLDSLQGDADQKIAHQEQVIGMYADENEELKQTEMNDQLVEQAAAQFSEDEPDVYRQKNKLIIRLKSMRFPTGRSELPTESIDILSKVKDIIKELGPSEVLVQGHTDGIGNAKVNQKLSEKRAHSVATFFANDNSLEQNQIDAQGLGYNQPLSTNKTKEGRAKNRRVDIVITPNQNL